MERGHHFCLKDPNFIENFKILYNNGHEALFTNKNLQFKITNDLKSMNSLNNFMEDIANFEGIEDLRHKSISSTKSSKILDNPQQN